MLTPPESKPVHACYRALADDTEADFDFAPHATDSLAGAPAQAWWFVSSGKLSGNPSHRGELDYLAGLSRYHDSVCHTQHRPNDTEGAQVFDMLEALRIEVQIGQGRPGVLSNMAACIHAACSHSRDDRAMAWRMFRTLLLRKPSKPLAPSISATGMIAELAPLADELRSHISDQVMFAQAVLNALHQPVYRGLLEQLAPTPVSSKRAETSADDIASDDPLNHDQILQDATEAEPQRLSETKFQTSVYAVFTTAFDQVVGSNWLRQQLTTQDQTNLRLLAHLPTQSEARSLQQRLFSRQRCAWKYDLEEGVLDSARLSRVVANPTQINIHKHAQTSASMDTAVTLLVDNSGSMRGERIAMAAACADSLAKYLEPCGIAIEVLGFTTGDFDGGRSRARWASQGEPNTPGRLCDLRHVVYKSFNQPYRRVCRNFPLMLNPELLRENIDGEALMWCRQRLSHRSESRKIMIVISDGAPRDESTLKVNSSSLLSDHLHAVIDEIENRSPIELIAIGLGHDVNRYYSQAITLWNPSELGPTLFKRLANLL